MNDTIARADLTVGVRYVGSRADLDYATYPAQRVTLPAYTTVGAGAAFTLLRVADRQTTLTVRVDNLFDVAYEEILHKEMIRGWLADHGYVLSGIERGFKRESVVAKKSSGST